MDSMCANDAMMPMMPCEPKANLFLLVEVEAFEQFTELSYNIIIVLYLVLGILIL